MTKVEDAVVAPAPADRKTSPGAGARVGGGTSRPGRRRGLTGRLNAAVAATPVVFTDAAVVGFAIWTLLYHLNLGLNLRPSVIFLAWVVLLPVAAYVAWRFRRRDAVVSRAADEAVAAPAEVITAVDRASLLRRYALPVGTAVAAALFAAVGTGTLSWWLAAVLGLVSVVSAWLALSGRGGPAATGAAPAVRETTTTPAQAYVVLAVALAAAYFATLIGRVSLDDVFYVGKSVWVAERDQIPFRDFLFTEGVLPGGSANPPLPSFEVFIGALARTLHVHAASATWYLLLPVLAVFAILALWRLVQRWAPRRPLVVFGVAVAYILLVAYYADALNTYHLPRLTQGKSVFVHALIPLAWVYLTDYLEHRSRRALVLLALLSVASVGYTTTAVILLPLLAAAAGVVLLATRRVRDAVLCFAAASVYPLLSGVLVQVLRGGVEEAAATYSPLLPLRTIYELTLWLGVLGVIGGLAVWWSPLLLRRGAPQQLAAGAALAVTALMVPGLLKFGGDLSGLTAVLWRVPWILPVPALVGVLAVIRLPGLARVNRVLAVALPVVLVFAFYTQGKPMWAGDLVQSKPTWRMPETRKDVSFWIKNLDRPEGLVLAPSTIMRALPQVTTEVRVVLPRDLYLTDYGPETEFSQDRLLLARFADGQPVSIYEVDGAMRRVGVSVVCVWKTNTTVADAARYLGLERFASRKSPGGMYCYRTTAGATPTTGG
ncbi:DUF6077 domain-containing protein [Micromonospora lupini]|uniref:Glycosyltransferase RgtA/B/C/D-like domain-containing protein n=1 Tax=Micromonospora lupini str. Lupac 08 TaxID=1150864 RepID=I0L0D6_9ACTN|nr:DUF6077 domain-containing protein [Micromonospora lupini]CCH17283.1 conserved membrane hypothetical protein [Micromonospora lupini str. Lupac 08]